jgi:hypothetical protein
MMAYEPAPVPPGTVKTAEATPLVTVPLVTELLPAIPETENVTVPAFTVLPALETVACNVTLWLLDENVVETFAAEVVVSASMAMVSVLLLVVATPAPPALTLLLMFPDAVGLTFALSVSSG